MVDTSIWSELLRRKLGDPKHLGNISRLIEDERAVITGAIRQELLCGLRGARQFNRVRRALRALRDVVPKIQDYERAAQFCNLCAKHGLAASSADFLICALASRRRMLIYTSDRDFDRLATILPIRLFAHGRS